MNAARYCNHLSPAFEMTTEDRQYFTQFAVAFARGRLVDSENITLEERQLLAVPLEHLSAEQMQSTIELGKQHELKMHKFKRTMGLARVSSVLGILRGLQPANLLDVGSGRGVFLWPLLDAFECLPVTCIDFNPLRVRDINAVHSGGIERLQALEADITKTDLPEQSFDTVTFLEALEHIENPQAALDNVVRLAKRFVVLSVPSHEDDNPEHIHLFDKRTLTAMLTKAGARHVNVQYVHNHMIVVARIAD